MDQQPVNMYVARGKVLRLHELRNQESEESRQIRDEIDMLLRNMSDAHREELLLYSESLEQP